MKFCKIQKAEYTNISRMYLFENKTIYNIAHAYNVSPITISRILKSSNIEVGIYQTNNNKIIDIIDKNIQEKIISLYALDISIKNISHELDIPTYKIKKILKNKKIFIRSNSWECKQFKTNKTYFDVIDTEYKAYFLGLLYADGCNYKNKKISITLCESDRNVLDALNIEIHTNQKKLYFAKSKNIKHSNFFTLVICDTDIAKSLNKIGLVQRKSLILTYPDNVVPEHLFRHFLRGYFDGDGSVYFSGNKIIFELTGTSEFLSTIKEKLEVFLNLKINCKLYATNSIYTKEFKTSNSNYVLKIFDFMYKDSTIFLHRKYNKYKKFKDSVYGNN